MTPDSLQELCERGQEALMAMDYLAAEAALAQAEHHAWSLHDWDALARLYMPLQEARRQRRQRCGEGIVCLDLISQGPDDHIDARHVIENYAHGQLLVAGWGTIEPAVQVRALAAQHGLYVETFLGAAYPVESSSNPQSAIRNPQSVVAIIPLPDARNLPAPEPMPLDVLLRELPPHSIVRPLAEFPRGGRRGDTRTYAEVMALWERLHAPFLASADVEADAIVRMNAYRRTIEVDYASELAHQKLSDAAHAMVRRRRQ